MNPNFTKISSEYLPTIDVTLEYYEHNRTKAKHIHFASQNAENVFMVALRTMPHDSTGVAHILEHTALCGSKNFPIRDPFFGMLKRSMQTFMNAFTSSDWTAYPFATENKQDFDNLLRVYLDAVFFPNLDEFDFMQEWHRFDFDEAGNLVIKGVVYNEMKGVYGDVYSRIYEINKSLLHPETTYHYDSGGLPQAIPHLSYDNFLAFHKKHYHPTNATFMTFWDISAEKHQENFENLVLKNFDSEGEKVTTTDETRYLSPVYSRQFYPSTDRENPHQTHILFSWLLDAAHDAEHALEANIVYNYLLTHSGSPLRHALETAEFSASVSPLSMLDDSGREIRITTGIVTDDEKYADDTEKLIYETLEKVITDGVDPHTAEGILDAIEMSLRELSTGYPYGLSLMLQAIGAVTHEENISLMLDPSPLLDTLREKVKNRHFIGSLIEKFFIKNNHKTRLVLIPSETADAEEKILEKNFCEKRLAKMSESEKSKIRENAKKLEEHQKKPQNMELLPKIALSDVPREMKKLPKPTEKSEAFSHYSLATNKISYIEKIFPLTNISLADAENLSLTNLLIGELGFAGENYGESQKKIAEKMGLSARFATFMPYGSDNLQAFFAVKWRFLEKNSDASLALISEILDSTRFDEIDHIRQYFGENLLTMRSGFTSSGHATAMRRAGSGHTLGAHISEKISGISSMEFLQTFLKKSDAEMREIFEKNFKKFTENPEKTIIVAKEKFADSEHENSVKFENISAENFTPYRTNEAWLTDLAVGYCAMSVRAVPSYHEDAPLFILLGQFLRDGYLHSAIREQGGAYGSGANYDAASESFRFFSYRDPRIEGTFADFENAITWLLENDHDEERLDEAKIGVIARVDAPQSPSSSAFADAFYELTGYTNEIQNRERAKVLDATIDDLKNLAKKYLMNLQDASRVVITGKQNREICEKMGFEIHELE